MGIDTLAFCSYTARTKRGLVRKLGTQHLAPEVAPRESVRRECDRERAQLAAEGHLWTTAHSLRIRPTPRTVIRPLRRSRANRRTPHSRPLDHHSRSSPRIHRLRRQASRRSIPTVSPDMHIPDRRHSSHNRRHIRRIHPTALVSTRRQASRSIRHRGSRRRPRCRYTANRRHPPPRCTRQCRTQPRPSRVEAD